MIACALSFLSYHSISSLWLYGFPFFRLFSKQQDKDRQKVSVFKVNIFKNRVNVYVINVHFCVVGFSIIYIFRYWKVLLLQYRIWKCDNKELRANPEIFDDILDEIRRSRRIKAVESYSESAPQMILQLFIICKRMCDEHQKYKDYSVKNHGNHYINLTYISINIIPMGFTKYKK